MKKMQMAAEIGIAVTIVVGVFVWAQVSWDQASSQAIQALQQAPLVKKGSPRVVDDVPVKKDFLPDALSFWTGEVIVGGDAIELVAIPGKEAVILAANKQGVCHFDAIEGMKAEEVYIRLQEDGQPPLISCAKLENGREIKMHSVYRLRRFTNEKPAPLLVYDRVSPAERQIRQKGQFLEGPTWHVKSYDIQIYGHEMRKHANIRY